MPFPFPPNNGIPLAPLPDRNVKRFQRGQEREVSRMLGRVKWFNKGKGFGFIDLEAGKLAFVNCAAIECDGYRILEEGDQVECEVVEEGSGLRATRVKRVKVG